MSWLSSWLHPERGFQAGQGQLDKYYNEGKVYQQPYNEAGINQAKTLQEMIDKLSHPEKLQDEWSKNYSESQAAKDAQAQAQNHGLNAASSMGLMGSNTALNAIQSGTSQIGAQDKQKYLDDLMNKYTTGVQTAQGLYNTGAQTAGQMGTNANNMGTNSAGMQFGKTNAGGEQFGKISGNVLSALMSYLTGGMGTGGYGRGAWSSGGS